MKPHKILSRVIHQCDLMNIIVRNVSGMFSGLLPDTTCLLHKKLVVLIFLVSLQLTYVVTFSKVGMILADLKLQDQ